MGNRAVITTSQNYYNHGPGIYVHWNGGRDSVEGFLKYCELRSFAPISDYYGMARMVQVIANFLGGDGLSIGLDSCDTLDCNNGDNGVYFVEGFKIVGRQHFINRTEQQHYDLVKMVKSVDASQPINQQLGERMIDDLLFHGVSIHQVDSMYHYSMSKHENGGFGFQVGEEYTYAGRDIKILAIKEHTAFIEYQDHAGEVPLFHWRDGTESVIFKDEHNRDCQIASDTIRTVI